MSILNLFKFKIDYTYPLLLMNIFKKRKMSNMIEDDTNKVKKVKLINKNNNDLYNKLIMELKNNNDINIIDEFNNLVINFKNPSFGFSIRIKKENNYIKTELMINNNSCYSSQLNYDEPYHIHYTIDSVIDDILNVFETILRLKYNDTKWISFTFVTKSIN